MVERVARAIGNKIAPALNGGPAVKLSDVARAAIEAMREPTHAIFMAGREFAVLGSKLTFF